MPDVQTTPHAAPLPPTQSVRWDVDPSHSSVQFSVRHMMITTVRGRFSGVKGTVDTAPELSQSKIQVTVDAASVATHDEKRDAHLKSPDFFEVDKFPHLSFTSKRIEKKGDHEFKLFGDFTIHGVTREAAFDVSLSEGEIKDPYGFIRRGASATTKINRKDFGLTFNMPLEGGGVMVGETVSIEVDLELTRKP